MNQVEPTQVLDFLKLDGGFDTLRGLIREEFNKSGATERIKADTQNAILCSNSTKQHTSSATSAFGGEAQRMQVMREAVERSGIERNLMLEVSKALSTISLKEELEKRVNFAIESITRGEKPLQHSTTTSIPNSGQMMPVLKTQELAQRRLLLAEQQQKQQRHQQQQLLVLHHHQQQQQHKEKQAKQEKEEGEVEEPPQKKIDQKESDHEQQQNEEEENEEESSEESESESEDEDEDEDEDEEAKSKLKTTTTHICKHCRSVVKEEGWGVFLCKKCNKRLPPKDVIQSSTITAAAITTATNTMTAETKPKTTVVRKKKEFPIVRRTSNRIIKRNRWISSESSSESESSSSLSSSESSSDTKKKEKKAEIIQQDVALKVETQIQLPQPQEETHVPWTYRRRKRGRNT